MQTNQIPSDKLSFRISEKQWTVFFLILLVGNGILPQIIPGSLVSPLFMGIELAMIPFALFFFPVERQIKTFMAFAFLGYEYPLILGAVLFLFALAAKTWVNGNMKFHRPMGIFLLIILYSLFLFVLNAWHFVSFSGLIFWSMTFLGPFILLLYFSQFRLTHSASENLFNFFKRCVTIQFPILILQALNMKTLIPGDWAGGSMLDAHNCGVFIGLYCFTLILPKITGKAPTPGWLSWSLLKKIIPALFFLLLTDAKTVYLVQALGFLLFLLLILAKSLKHKYAYLPKIKIARYATLGLSALMLLPILGQAYVRFAMNNPEADLYEIVGNYLLDDFHAFGEDHISNQKAVLYNRVFSVMKSDDEWLWWIGTGPGTFGSRAANTLAYDVLYKESQKIPPIIPPVSSPWTKKYLGDLMTKELVEIVLFRSAVLASPVSGIVALKAELGWLGLFLFLFFVIAIASRLIPGKGNPTQQFSSQLAGIFWLMIPLLMVFDNYQEKPIITFPLILLTAVTLQSSVPKKS